MVVPATPTLVTRASAPVVVGGQLGDTATLGEGVAPTGAVTFRLFGPDDATCATEVFASVVAVTGNGEYISAPFATTTPGLYRWIAAYGGDGANASVTGACGDANESTVVVPATPTLVTRASAPVVVGGHSATPPPWGEGVAPTGAVTFRLFGPDDATCATEVFASVVAVTGNGEYIRAPFAATTPGLYRWIAAYGGDGANAAVTGACGDANESTVVVPATPTLVTRASAPVVVGGRAERHRHPGRGGGPHRRRHLWPVRARRRHLRHRGVRLGGGRGRMGEYISAPFTTTTPGLYRWIAAYGGDGANAAVTGACSNANKFHGGGPGHPHPGDPGLGPGGGGRSVRRHRHPGRGGGPHRRHHLSPVRARRRHLRHRGVRLGGGRGRQRFLHLQAPFAGAAPGLYRWIAAYGGDGANAAVTGACTGGAPTSPRWWSRPPPPW